MKTKHVIGWSIFGAYGVAIIGLSIYWGGWVAIAALAIIGLFVLACYLLDS